MREEAKVRLHRPAELLPVALPIDLAVRVVALVPVVGDVAEQHAPVARRRIRLVGAHAVHQRLDARGVDDLDGTLHLLVLAAHIVEDGRVLANRGLAHVAWVELDRVWLLPQPRQ
eukprot:2724630-Prymnesium_polylepis.1